MLTNGDQVGNQGHHRLEAKIRAPGFALQRRDAVENNAWARPVEVRLRPQQNAAGGRNGAHPRFAFAKGIKNIELLFRCATLWLIRAGKVTDDIHRLTHIFALAQALIKGFGLLLAHAQTVHASVEFHPHGNRLTQIGGFQRCELFFVMHGGVQMLVGNRRQIGGFEKAFE
ncbi:hypothetical protein D3C76_1171560 [compost metagenome]